MEFISPQTRSRIQRRGISEADIAYCLKYALSHYQARMDMVFVAKLQDGRNIKVAVRSSSGDRVANAFFFS